MSKSVACNFCGKTYKRPGSLKRHLNICEIICNSKKTTELNQEENRINERRNQILRLRNR